MTKRHLFAALAVCAAAALALGGSVVAQTTGPSTTEAPYLTSHLPGVTIESILTVDDGVTIPKTGGGTTRLVGIPDGIGVIDGSELSPPEPDFFYLLVNHELNSTQGIARDHGEIGAFVSKWRVNKTNHEVVEGDDLIKQWLEWNEGSQTFTPGLASFDRMCSSDRPDPSSLFNSQSGLGSQEIFYLNGEETFGGRAIGTVVTGPDAGNAYHLEHFGFAAFENVLLSPLEQDATVAISTDDASNGEVYIYVGQKQASGTEPEKAGLVGGDLYALAVVGKPYEYDLDLATAVGGTETFALKLVGTNGNRPLDGADLEARGADTLNPVDPTQTFESLKMGGPEDGAWDTRPGFENTFYFVTKGTSSNSLTAVTRLWKLEFADMADPAQGGTMTLLIDGPGNRLGSLDNMDFEVSNGEPVLFIQEDLGGDNRLSKIWEYNINTGQIEEVAQHASQTFIDGGSSFLTTNEESSGMYSLKNVLGDGWYASSIQVHTGTGLSAATEMVEYGQVVLINLAGRGTDTLRERVVQSGDTWDYRVDGVDPGANWNQVGFTIDANWNVDTNGTATGPVPSMLGYGESAGRLNTDLGQPASPRPAAYYFRKEFDLADPNGVNLFDLYMKADDGAVVYINGVEVARYNMALDLVVDNDTFASRNEPSEIDWKQIPVLCENVPLQATGNVLAISMHQENSGSSDMRMDAELFAWNNSPDAGAAPAIPANVSAGNPTEVSIDLSWDAQADAKFFRIERQIDGDVTWEVVAREYPGDFTSFIDGDVAQGTTYNYRLAAVNIHGRSDCSLTAQATTLVSDTPVLFMEDFEVPNSFGQFTAVDVAEPLRNYSWLLWDFGSTGAVQGNGFGGGAGPTEDWLITTDPINLHFAEGEQLVYDSQISFSGPAPQVLISTDYDGAGDPNTATWTLINEDTSSFSTLTPVGPFDLGGIEDAAYLAFKYTSLGSSGGQSVRFTLDDVIIEGTCGFDFEGAENSDIEADGSTAWSVVNYSSEFGWIYDTRDGRQGAINNNFGSGAGGIDGGTASDDWLISPAFTASDPNTLITFDYYERFGDTLDRPLVVLVTDNYTGDPRTTIWNDITPAGLNGSTDDAWIPVQSSAIGVTGNNLVVAFHYTSAGNGGGTTKRIGVDTVCVQGAEGALAADFDFTRNGGEVNFISTVTGGTPPYTYDWNFGDGGSSTESDPVYTYTDEGSYTVTLTVTDDAGDVVVVEKQNVIVVTSAGVPAPAGDVRVATFNASMNRPNSGDLAEALAAGDDPQIQLVAETIQRVNPDVLLINEFDQLYDEFGNYDAEATEASVEDFLRNYLEVAQADDTDPVFYSFYFVAPANTGVPSGFDLDNDGQADGPGDGYGFGSHPGQFAMVLLSRYQIEYGNVRTYQRFLWKDMPGAFLPPDPQDSDNDGDLTSFYTAEELEIFRLSSKSHWDVRVRLPRGAGKFNVLMSHPTPPVFDDGTAGEYPDPNVADWNGLRNHDEIRFWADYISQDKRENRYMYDDNEWDNYGTTPPDPNGGLRGQRRFVILGDLNADPDDGDATFDAINQLLNHPKVNTSITPSSAGALEFVQSGTNRETKTATFELRADYALPSVVGWDFRQGFVFWPVSTDLEADLNAASDHRMVVIDLTFVEPGNQKDVLNPTANTGDNTGGSHLDLNR